MIRAAEFIRFDRLSGSGRNAPPLIAVETVDGEEHEAVMKPAGWKSLTIKSATLEAISSSVAGLVNVPVCEPFFVSCAPEMIAAIPNVDIKSALAPCTWPAFASKHAGKQWRLWTTGDLVTPERKADAILNCLPNAWGSAAQLAQTAIKRVKEVRDNIDACIDELKRVLS